MDILTTVSPVTNKPLCTRTEVPEVEIPHIARRSAQAFLSWRATPLSQRQQIVTHALDGLWQRKEELGRELTEQMGRPIAYSHKEVETAVKRGQYLVRISSETLADTPGDAEPGFSRYIRKCPRGPVLVLFAWNYPYLILVNSLVPALLAGNTVILKPSPQTPSIVEQVKSAFESAGLPSNVIQYVHCGSTAKLKALIRCPEVSLVCFTGSVEGGLMVQQAVAETLVPVVLELGGKDAAYVRSDVDVAWAAEEIVDGAIFNSGQSCCSIERVYVAASIHDRFVAEIQRVLRGYRLGLPTASETNLGPVVSKKAMTSIEAQIHDALAQGANDMTPDNVTFTECPAEGNYVKPRLLVNVDHQMSIMRDETFGPVIPVMKVHDDDEAVRLMNDSSFGLTGSIWTKDIETGERLAERVEAGTVFVNRCDYPSPDLAWTGWKESGRGVSLSKFGFEQFVKLKSFHVKVC